MKLALICALALTLAACANKPPSLPPGYATIENLASDDCRAALMAGLGAAALEASCNGR